MSESEQLLAGEGPEYCDRPDCNDGESSIRLICCDIALKTVGDCTSSAPDSCYCKTVPSCYSNTASNVYDYCSPCPPID